MSAPTGVITEDPANAPYPWHLRASVYFTTLGGGRTRSWVFRRRVDAIAFAARRGIRIVEER